MLSFPAPSIIMKDRRTPLQNAARRKTFLHISLSAFIISVPLLCVCGAKMYIQCSVCKCVDPMGKVPRSALIQNCDWCVCLCKIC